MVASLFGFGQPADTAINRSQAAHLWRAIRNNQRDVYIMVTGDSTGNESWEWVYLMTQWLAEECPTHTIKYRLFDDSTTAWDTYTTVQTGTGPALPFTTTPFTIYVDNGSVSGTNTFYTQGGRAAAFWTGIDYDLTIINYGHNLGTAMTEAIALPEWVIELAYVRQMAPRAGLFVTLQNPRSSVSGNINTNGSAQSARMVAAWRKAAELVGAGIIDVYTAFNDSSSYPSLMGDETHPNTFGQQVWVDQVKLALAEPADMSDLSPFPYNPLAEARSNMAPNPRFADWTLTNPDNWTFTNCTPTKDLGRSDGSLYTMRITVGAGTSPTITADISSKIAPVSGQVVTFAARIWRPSNLGLLGGRIEIASTDNVLTSASFVSYPRGVPSSGGWEWVQATLAIPRTHTQLTLRIYAGAADGSDSGKVFWISNVWCGPGWMPSAASLESATNQFVLDYYGAGNVGPITGNTGTIVTTGTTITLTGAPATNSDVYINLPGLTPGEQYTVTFNADSCTGNTAGGIYIRNGFNGGFTTITTGLWTVGSGASVTFTAPSGPVSVWIFGYTGATGWQMSSVSIAPVNGARFTADFSNATIARRLMFQSWVTNGVTSVGAIPNGTATTASYRVFNGTDTANSANATLQISSAEASIASGITGTGTYLPMTFYTGGSEAMRISTTRNVSIGIASDAVDLLQIHRGSGSGITSGISLTTAAGGVGDGSYIKWTGAVTNEKIARIDGVLEGTDLGSIRFNTGNGADGFAERLRIDSSGNVGIGTASPGTKLDVFNTGTTTTDFRVHNSTVSLLSFVDSGASYVGASTNHPLLLITNNNERMRIDSSGNVGIGIAPSFTLDVYRSSTTTSIVTARNDTSTTVMYATSSASFAGTTTNTPFGFLTNNAERMRIDASGNVGIGGSASRATTVGSAALNIFNGTAPAGTLANGISLYSNAGEAYVMDAAGNATLFSPHDSETNEWIFRSKHTPTGKVLKIDVEKMLRFINEHFDLDMVHEFTEE
jgi:hypothetical protein